MWLHPSNIGCFFWQEKYEFCKDMNAPDWSRGVYTSPGEMLTAREDAAKAKAAAAEAATAAEATA